ncbi:hypothetical protein ATANTOWER_019949 [Ataeniobius toweri]|uniref:Ig-like domain-containing protein n=1 Tax=Ataeniobius toweri TaxID=208326 RepID=A0ABU7AGL0_9TELE|nr:hypothetical protein [Ataeniobius toweri]
MLYLWVQERVIRSDQKAVCQSDAENEYNTCCFLHFAKSGPWPDQRFFSCKDPCPAENLAGQGQDVVEILVIANCIPAALSVAGPNTVNEGKHVEFKCTFSETLHTLNNCQLIYCCLKKNETFIQFQVFDVARMEASFTIEDAVARDSGHYSCLLLPSKCFQNSLNELQGINDVFLEVKEYLIPWGALICGFTVFLLLYSLCLFWIFNKKGLADTTSCKPCLNSEQLETDTVLDQTYAKPEEAEDPRMQTDRQHDEEEDSFSVESEEEIQNHVQTSMDDNYHLYNMIYSLPDESPARPRSTLVLHMTSPIKQ